jgi:hypothetical protein
VSGDTMLLLVQGTDFSHIRKVIRERLRFMDGVSRLRELKVIPFEQ